VSDELGSLGVAQPAEDGHTSEDARDRFGVHAPDDTLGRPSGFATRVRDAQKHPPNVLMKY